MRAEELVGRADEDVDAPVSDVDRAMRAVVDRVRPRKRAGIVRELDDAADVRECPDCVRRDGESDYSCAVTQLPLQI